MSVKMKFGSKDIPFVYKGDKLVYPNPIRDGLLLWYDFKGMRNTDMNKEVAKDLSGNGNDGTLTNFNFTEGSGYKDNTLVFDGVDDSLTIPELELDETAMSVMHDGKIYSYEDDKVLTVGEDGEIVGRGINLFNRSMIKNLAVGGGITGTSGSILSRYDYRGCYIKVKPGEVYSISRRNTINNRFEYGFTVDEPKPGVNIGHGAEHREDLRIEGIVIPEDFNYLFVYLSNQSDEIPDMQIVRDETATTYSPSPKEYKSTSLSPTSLTDLQLYNKTLRKDELLHNAESKGLKKLKDGVPVQDGLVLHYDFSHESNTSEYKDKAFDYSGNGNHGELQNFNFTEESGYEGNKLKFDGVDDRVALNTELPTVCTYEATFVRTSGFSWKPPMSSLQISSARETGFAMTPVANGIVVSAGNGVDRYKHLYFYTDPIPENELTHLVTSYDGASFSVYLNGIFIGTQPYNLVQNNYLNLGNWSRYTGSGYWYNWETHSAKIYNRALTPEEIAHNYAIEKEKFNIE